MTNKEAIAWLNNLITSIGEPQHSSLWHYEKALSEIKDMLGVLPSAQPEPKTGKWIRHDEVRNVYGGTYVECSECGEKYVVQYIEDEKYCRNCGADMRGEQDG